MKEQGGFVKRFMTVPEVAAYFSFSRAYVYDLVNHGRLKAWHPEQAVGKRGLRITVESVTALESGGHIGEAQKAG